MQFFTHRDSHNRPRWRTRRRALGRAIAAGALAISGLAFAICSSASAQTNGRAQALITQAVNENNLVALAGNTRPEARNPANDRGRMGDDVSLPHLMLQLRRPAAQEQALEALIVELHDPHRPTITTGSPPTRSARSSGRRRRTSAAVTDWLQQHGFTVNAVYPERDVDRFFRHRGPGHRRLPHRDPQYLGQRRHPLRQYERPADPGGFGARGRRHRVAAQHSAAALSPRKIPIHRRRRQLSGHAARSGDDLQFQSAVQPPATPARARPSICSRTPISTAPPTGAPSVRRSACRAIPALR